MPRNDVALGVFETPPSIPGGQNGLMKCPTCSENTPDAWKTLYRSGSAGGFTHTLKPPKPAHEARLDWMHCANPECGELVIRLHETHIKPGAPAPEVETLSWMVRPRAAKRAIPPEVPQEFRRDHQEATAILDASPRMSAVLSRRILADLLERYAGHAEFNLADRIDAFNQETQHPRPLRENLHHFREIANFGAHTQKDDQAEIIDVSREEAEWTLEIVERLFDHFIATPERDKKMRESIDKKLASAKRRPVRPLPPDEDSHGT